MLSKGKHNLEKYIKELPVGEVADKVNHELQETQRLVVTAPPGAGKSTLLPLTILAEHEDGKILMLEPRRIAARQIAERMAAMMGEKVGDTVGYRMRFETKVSDRTRIEVITEGILTRMIIDDPTLEGVSTVIFDEFHERSLASDTALALTMEAQQIVRPDLRILLMSATIDTDAICKAIGARGVESRGRMYDVTTIHMDEADQFNCAQAVASAIKKAHREQQGDILAFLPGQAEITKCQEILGDSLGKTAIFPLYGMLTPQQQKTAIMPSAEGERKVVIATPIAETSLTIEGIKTVVDSGLCKTLVFNPRNALSHLETVRISLDMARQRTGRAGRVSEGVCYRLWTKATEMRMDECRRPEIESADLASTMLDIAAWGEGDIMLMPWLTKPPTAHVAEAKRLLTMLGATDNKGAITPHGKRLAKLPCHPRIAQMLVKAENDKAKALAADIAAILEEKDPINSDNDADINTRIIMLREARRKKQCGRWARIAAIAEQYMRMTATHEDNTLPDRKETGRLIASAYPERVAMATEDCKYRLASGDNVTISHDDDLSACQLLAVASLAKRIFLAAPVERDTLENIAEWRDNISWDSKQGKAVARRELRLGALIIDTKPMDCNVRQAITEAICQAAPKEGLSMFDFNDNVARLQRRIATVSEWHRELDLPEVDNDAVLSRTPEWLPYYIGKATTSAELKKINMEDVIWGLLTYDQQTAVDRLAPSRILMPTGRYARIDYRKGAEAPVISVRLQECFGMTTTPTVDDGRKAVLMELLSPGFKPVQLTQDLASFWQTTYFEVRKELKRRYPKHQWPENPLQAK